MSDEVRVDTDFCSLPGEHDVGAIWRHVDMTDLAFAAPPPSVTPDVQFIQPGNRAIADDAFISVLRVSMIL